MLALQNITFERRRQNVLRPKAKTCCGRHKLLNLCKRSEAWTSTAIYVKSCVDKHCWDYFVWFIWHLWCSFRIGSFSAIWFLITINNDGIMDPVGSSIVCEWQTDQVNNWMFFLEILTSRKAGLTNFQQSLQYSPGLKPIILSMSSLKRSTP